MNRIRSTIITTSVLIFGIFSPREAAVAQTANHVEGTWVFVSGTLEQAGKKIDYWGSNPQGRLMFDANGHFSAIITRSDVPKFAVYNRKAGTPEENKAAVQGSIALFGRYSVSDKDKVITLHIEGSTFPNEKGREQKRPFKISGDQLAWTVPTPSVGSGTAYAIWKRAH
jgi:hypothetical protein